VDAVFLRRVRALLQLARPLPALWLVVLSVLEAWIGSRAGVLIGRFYTALVDRDRALFWGVVARAAGWYTLSALVAATTAWLAQHLAALWRRRLTSALQEDYMDKRAFYRLKGELSNPLPDNFLPLPSGFKVWSDSRI
jgi:ABC-type uncharacterized transport system fused permease/ATPase subunit